MRPLLQRLVKRYPSYLRKDLLVEAQLYIKCYQGHRDALPYMLDLHISRIASELRDAATAMDLETAFEFYDHKPWSYSWIQIEDVPSIHRICKHLDCTPRVAYRIRNTIQILITKMDYLP